MKIQFQPSPLFLNQPVKTQRPKMSAGLDQVSFGSATKTQQEHPLQFKVANYPVAKEKLQKLIEEQQRKSAIEGRSSDEFECLPAIIEDLETLKQTDENKTTLILAKLLHAIQNETLNIKEANLAGLELLKTELRDIAISKTGINQKPLNREASLKIYAAIKNLESKAKTDTEDKDKTEQQPIFSEKSRRIINWPMVEALLLTKNIGCLGGIEEPPGSNQMSLGVTLNSENLKKFNQIFGCKLEPVILNQQQDINQTLLRLFDTVDLDSLFPTT